MRLFRPHVAAGVVAALAGAGLLAPSVATAAPPAPPAAAPVVPAAADPELLPPPQEMSEAGVPFALTGDVDVVVGEGTDAAARRLVAEVVEASGGTVRFSAEARPGAATLYLGTAQDNPASAAVLAGFGVSGAEGLDAEGYVLASGRVAGAAALVLQGVDARGTYYAAQTLRALAADGTVPAVHVRDWPLMPVRGAIEGFYGIPWSHQARLDQLAFYGDHKMNTYVYTPKDDDYLRGRWRDPYPQAELEKLAELVDQANAHHVNFTFALSPGNDVCYSSDADLDATTAKFDQLRSIGVTSFYVALDDIPLELRCASDRERFTAGSYRYLADAQAFYLNRIVDEYVEPLGLEPLQTVPTNYSGSGEDPYKAQFGEQVDPSVRIQWTGEGVFSDRITYESVQRATQSYRTDHLYIWDNFPVNDGQRGRLFLNPLDGRDPNLHQLIDGFTANPMIEPYASMLALAGYGDYTWNGPAYDPATSMDAAVLELAGPDPRVRDALDVFVDLNQGWKPYRPSSESAPDLAADVAAFWQAYDAGEDVAGQPLLDRLATIEDLPQTLAAMAEPGFHADALPWLEAAAAWARAASHQVDALTAVRERRGEVATDAVLAAATERAAALAPAVPDLVGGVVTDDVITPTVGDGVFQTFLDEAGTRYDDWLAAVPLAGTAPYPATAATTMGTYGSNTPARMTDGDLGTLYWSNQAPAVGSAVTVDLGAVVPVGAVRVHQSDSDTATSGDMLYHARLEVSVDGSTWTELGTYDTAPRIDAAPAAPVDARYVRLAASATNPGGKWVKVRELQVFAPEGGLTTDLAAATGSAPANAVDADVTTAFVSAAAPVEASHLTREVGPDEEVGSVAVVGSVAGELQVRTADGWRSLGPLDPERTFQEAAVADEVSGVRILFAPGSPAPVVHELVVRPGGPVGDDPLVGGDVAVDVTAEVRPMGGAPYVVVRAVNGEDVPMRVEVESPFGSKAFESVASGASAYVAFKVRGPATPSRVTVVASVEVDGLTRTTTEVVDLDLP
ncbi:beta-N-acetylglucosaminidase domain-containing protein [Cellulosimicrobium protaetiae]|uniref:Carbohydrate-binding protein n=1 Tax=Cellulosimicrobium protaetiae TaxID=2587808 RepID=A0A6M5UDC8_9MICO|nr:beta-N-acetylglucosaminidase domain-containing protein [Cellulosimicrobium protaetiae]QJW35068.1 carbohydrate-binding protein [Cellulosimicrobium protaetiae]